MEIKQMGDLIPYHKSLQELWDKEEFQPVLAFLSSLRQEALDSFRTANLYQYSAEHVKTKISSDKTQYNLANMLMYLPDVIKEAKELILKRTTKFEAFEQSQETGEI
jgi:hypothetical protein